MSRIRQSIFLTTTPSRNLDFEEEVDDPNATWESGNYHTKMGEKKNEIKNERNRSMLLPLADPVLGSTKWTAAAFNGWEEA